MAQTVGTVPTHSIPDTRPPLMAAEIQFSDRSRGGTRSAEGQTVILRQRGVHHTLLRLLIGRQEGVDRRM